MSLEPDTGRIVRCPICVDQFPWPQEQYLYLFDEAAGDFKLVDIDGLDPLKQRDLIKRGYQRCPNPSDDSPVHYLPASYASYLDPLVVGLVGGPLSGKTHLLTAIIREALAGGLDPYGVEVTSLDFRRHAEFRRRFIEPFERGRALPGTRSGVVEAADILLLRGPGWARPLAFFDVSGEDLRSTDAQSLSGRFLLGAGAVIFAHGSEDQLEFGDAVRASENASFALAVERIRELPGAEQLPAAIVLTKSDRLRFRPPADRWLRLGSGSPIDARRIFAESRDVYAYLHHNGAASSLSPYAAFPRCTLHFVSASGGDAVPDRSGSPQMYFPRGVKPTRVLEPLVAILAMCGVLSGPEAVKVGAGAEL